MKVIVDTCVWSLALRRNEPSASAEVRLLQELVQDGRVALLGPIRQELLSGVKAPAQFKKLAEALSAFPDEQLDAGDYVEAARCFNRCRSKGVQGSNTDFLLCAVSLRSGFPILTTDGDFGHFKKVLRVKLAGTTP
jgi:predicted nucleic acid-binding protein